MIDRKGRVWLAATGHVPDNPAFCKKGSSHPSAVEFPLNSTNRRVTMYDPKTGKYTAYQTCFGSHHLQFGYDANETLWMSTGGGGGNVGWINTKMLDETGDIEKSQGWTALVLDTNGNGVRDEYTEPGKPMEPGKDMRIGPTFYAVMPSPVDGSVWGTLRGSPGAIVRIDPTKNPHKSLAEMYNVPLPGFGPRGGDIDKQGRVWVSLASGHMGVFDRRLCKGPLNGPKATGNHCPEGWVFHQYPGPGFRGIGENRAEASYYSGGEQHNRAAAPVRGCLMDFVFDYISVTTFWTILSTTHALLAVALLGALTHQAAAVLAPPRADAAGGFVTHFRSVSGPRYAAAVCV